MYTTGFGAQDGVNLGTVVRVAPGRGVERRRRTWTHSSAEGSAEGAHAVEFSKTVAPLLGRGFLPARRAQNPSVSERTDEYSAENRARGDRHEFITGRLGDPANSTV